MKDVLSRWEEREPRALGSLSGKFRNAAARPLSAGGERLVSLRRDTGGSGVGPSGKSGHLCYYTSEHIEYVPNSKVCVNRSSTHKVPEYLLLLLKG